MALVWGGFLVNKLPPSSRACSEYLLKHSALRRLAELQDWLSRWLRTTLGYRCQPWLRNWLKLLMETDYVFINASLLTPDPEEEASISWYSRYNVWPSTMLFLI